MTNRTVWGALVCNTPNVLLLFIFEIRYVDSGLYIYNTTIYSHETFTIEDGQTTNVKWVQVVNDQRNNDIKLCRLGLFITVCRNYYN